ncbi:F-box/kelch-repeat protein At3g23880-like [Cornus florida]|uniref:F-box/kelch-repeat protein At3g23880-like n=1 Tax=Cornus florida TaxID=4283 RepID=UPI00289998FA|nr:F-box/kelch-repeat protein At3g23880-like [Cornus florida]
MEGDTQSLPCDVIYTILSKLPVKSLFQLRCVCKSWRDIISEPKFSKSHLTESIKLVNRQRIFVRDTMSACFRSIGCEDGTGLDEELKFPVQKYRRAIVLCSCNGLVLLRAHKSDNMCVLWNPAIRDYKRFSCPSHISRNYMPHGLYYDSSRDDYKVIFFSKQPENNFIVFSFKGQSWTEPKKSPYLGFHGEMVLANGVLHLVALKPRKVANVRPPAQPYPFFYDDSDSDSEDGNTHLYKLVCFDTVDEKFKEMSQPNCINEGVKFSLTLMRGCLSLYCDTNHRKCVVVWTMKQYSDNNSWTKFIVIPRRQGICYFSTLTPLCATNKGEVVVMTERGNLLIYNDKENKLRHIWGENKHRPLWGENLSYPTLYVDTLVLPICATPVKRKRKREL